jgi:threonine/homoserine/homoserine lactone efflux protein
MDALGIVDLPVFLLAAAGLTATPGPDWLYIIGRGVSQGRGAALYSVLGISAGLCIHAVAASLGLSAIFAASPQGFTAVKWLGAAYLTFLGIRFLAAGQTQPAGPATAELSFQSPAIIFRQGLFTNLLNPKVALFFLAFLPQFVRPGGTHYAAALLLLGAVFIVIGTAGNTLVALASGIAGAALQRRGTALSWGRRVTGLLYIALGIHLARSRFAAL